MGYIVSRTVPSFVEVAFTLIYAGVNQEMGIS